MCGIAGIFSTDGPLGPSREILCAMADKLRHRGPDNEGFYEDLYAGFAFRRLSIIDLAGRNQPLINEDGSLVLVCNGEIFNYRELRAELVENGHTFYTQCDVEILLHLYEQHGSAMLQRLRGQFAFAILDRTQRQLFLARDHAGVAPLYYANVKNTFIFASEIKAILEHPLIERQVSLTGLDQILIFPGLISPTTMFEGINRVEPGHFLMVNSRGVQDNEYWDLNYPLDGTGDRLPEHEYIEALRSEFCTSIKRRLQADVPVGLYLSGGLDSSLIAAFTREVDASIAYDAFSVTFADER